MFTLWRGVENEDSEGRWVTATEMFPGIKFPSLDNAIEALEYLSMCMNCRILKSEGGLFKHILGVQAVFSQIGCDDDRQQNSEIILIRRLTT